MNMLINDNAQEIPRGKYLMGILYGKIILELTIRKCVVKTVSV
jgi:hypothetical protein